MKHEGVNFMAGLVAEQTFRLDIQLPNPDGRGWGPSSASIFTEDLGEQWLKESRAGAEIIQNETWVKANDLHFDAKCWPCVHPHGTGSLESEKAAYHPQSRASRIQSLARNRLALPQSWFRRSAAWNFWMYDRSLQRLLYDKEKWRRRNDKDYAAAQQREPDAYSRLFGKALPANIPETEEWLKKQRMNVFAAADEAELGRPQTMTTITHNDSSPEMLAVVRRGPLAEATRQELTEYLQAGWSKSGPGRPRFEDYPYETSLCHHRRVQTLKRHFMRTHAPSPRGIVEHWCDRTEYQKRCVPHSHIGEWWRKRPASADYELIPPVPRSVQGDAPKQRATNSKAIKLETYQEDALYYSAHIARIVAEMVRPDVSTLPDGTVYGGFDFERLVIAGLARTIQSRLYIHQCSPKYCLQNSCQR
jgi:hypothetical protein